MVFLELQFVTHFLKLQFVTQKPTQLRPWGLAVVFLSLETMVYIQVAKTTRERVV